MKVIYEGKEVELQDGANGFIASKVLDAENKKSDVGVKVGDSIKDMREPLSEGEAFSFVKIGSPEAFEMLNHSTSHLMAQALRHLYPDCKFGFGPAIEEGFYYDVDFGDKVVTDADFPAIEAEMKKLAKEDNPFIRKEVSAAEAKEIFKDNPYKEELIAEHERN